jgi:signal transduction histidine kinase
MTARRSTGRPRCGLAVAAASVVLGLGALVLVAVAEAPFGPDVTWYDDRDFFSFYVLVGLSSGPASALVVARTRHPAGPLCALISLCFAAAAACLAWSFLAAERDWPGVGITAHVFGWSAAPGSFLAACVLPWLLRPERPGRLPRAAATAGAVAAAVITVAGATVQQPGVPPNPLSLADTPLGDLLVGLTVPAMIVVAAVALLAVGDVVRRWRSAGPDDARAYGVLALAVGLLVGAMVVLHVSPLGTADAVALPVVAIAQVLLTLAVLALTLRAWDGDERPSAAVPRVAVWFLLSAVVVALYVGLITAVGALLPTADVAASAAAIAVLAVLVDPLRRSLQRRVDLLVHGAASDPVVLLARLGSDLRGCGDRDALRGLVHRLRDSLRLGWVCVSAPDEPQVWLDAGRQSFPPGEQQTYPLVVEGRHVGDLHLEAAPGERIDPRVRRAVRRLADVVAVTLDLTRANLRLETASARLAQVRDEERRLLRRELHDGMGPVLAGVGLGLAAAQRRLRRDPASAEQLLEELRTEVARRSDGVRMLARSLLPAELDDGDLAGALRVLAARFSASGLDVGVDASGLGSLDARRQVAAYHVAGEALLNAYRHAGGTRVSIRVASTPDGGVELEVVDDGRGIDPAAPPGLGLVSMRERASELAGSLGTGPGPGGRGTAVRMVLP